MSSVTTIRPITDQERRELADNLEQMILARIDELGFRNGATEHSVNSAVLVIANSVHSRKVQS